VAKFLLANNAEVNAIANNGSTPFKIAANNHKNITVELLREHGGHE
jgi:ankyrin repeat protein